MEEWRWIKGYEGRYMVSNHGRIKSFCKYGIGRVLSIKNQKGDYLRVVLIDKNAHRKTFAVHALVATAFIGDIPTGFQVHHIDRNKQNNCFENLQIMNGRDHRQETLLNSPQIVTGMVNYNKYVKPRPVAQYSLTGKMITIYPNAKEASKATGVCCRNIHQVAAQTVFNSKGSTRKQAGGYVWKFQDGGSNDF